METMYEVLRFVDQGVDCRQTIDCLEGKLLIYYLQEQPEMKKQRLWDFGNCSRKRCGSIFSSQQIRVKDHRFERQICLELGKLCSLYWLMWK